MAIGKPKPAQGEKNTFSPRVQAATKKMGELMQRKVQRPVKSNSRGG